MSRLMLVFLVGLLLVAPGGSRLELTATRPPAAAGNRLVAQDWCDHDGFCFQLFGPDCDDNDPLTYPDAWERADLKDNNCNGFGDEPPVGFVRDGYSGQGFASAVEWYGDYVYLAAGAVLQVYHAPPGADPELVREIEFRDWVREMVVDGDTLFVAARGDGLFALDLAGDPSHPQPAGQITGIFDAGEYTDVEAVFNEVDARNGRVAVARANNVGQSQGGVDALVYDYDPASDTFTLVRAVGTEVRSNTVLEDPIAVGLTEDAGRLYIGYGVLAGELVYVPLDNPEAPVLHLSIGAAMDIKVKGDTGFVAVTKVDWPWVDVSMLSRVSIVAGALVEEPLVTNAGSSAGNAVDIDGDLLCFGTWSPARYEEGYNLWVFTDLLADTPTRVGAAGTLDWIFRLACRDSDSGSDWIYVADEWGGLELWKSDGSGLSLDLGRHRVATGALSYGMWNDGSRIYSIKEGAGVWAFDEHDPQGERVVVEWIDRSDPGCSCQDCCPPDVGERPFPPAVFVSAGASNQGRVVLLAQDRNTAVPGAGYFMLFEEEEVSGEYELIYSEPVPATAWSGNRVATQGEILFATTSAHALRVYQHCPRASNQVRFLGEIGMPSQEDNLVIADVAAYEDYLFVTEVHDLPLAVPDSGKVHAYQWKQGDLATCPDRPSLLDPPAYLGSFAADVIPGRLLVDSSRDRLIVGATSKPTFPVKEGALLFYDLSSFDPANPADLDNHRTDVSPDASMRVTYANIHGLALAGDALYVVDLDNGLYQYSLSQAAYVRFYPAHRGSMSQPYVPQLVQSPEDVVPLYHPVAVTLTPAGNIMVQGHVTGRVSILRPAGTADTPWPTFGHDPQHTGRSEYHGPQNPVRLWAYAVPRGRMMNFAPSVDADGTLYIGTWGDIADGNAPGKLYALRPDGSLKWVFDPGPPEQPSQNQHKMWGTIEASVAIAADGTLYFGRGDNKLYALHPDGSLKWVFRTFPEGFPEQGGQVISSPTIGPAGTIYFGTVPYTEAGISALFAVNPDGTEKWHIQMGTTEGVWASPALGTDGTIYVGARDGNFYAIEDRGQGDYRIRWTYRPATDYVNWFGPASIGPDGTIYAPAVEVTGICTAVGKLYALTDLGETFEEKWAFAAPGPDEAAINLSIAADGTIYAGAASLNNHQSLCNKPDVGNLYALTDNGPGLDPTLKWTYAAGGGVSGTAIGADGTVYVAVRGDTSTQLSAGLKEGVPGRVDAVNPEDGSSVWPAPYQAAGEIWGGTPVLGADGTLYFADAPCADTLNIFPCDQAPALYALGDVANDSFLFGIGYADERLAATFADTGARQAKVNYSASWNDIEPDPPEDGVHTYRWDSLDKLVAEYQSYGFSEMHLTLQSRSHWGTELDCGLDCRRSSLPRPEHWPDYEAYVRAVVERYDHDGADDMPGLRYPIQQYEIETEADGWWPPTCMEEPDNPDRAGTYLQLLDATQRVARDAYPDVQILPTAMLFFGLFSGEPDHATIAARRAERPWVDCLTTFNEQVLRHPELFDAVEFHFLGDDYREVAATIRWLQDQMQTNGYRKPIFPSDVVSAPSLVPTSFFTETFRYPQDIVKGYLDVMHDNIMSDTVSSEYVAIREWYAGEQAEFTVKLLLTAMAEGAAGTQLAAMTDFPWMFCVPPWWPADPYQFWNWGIHGMVDVDWGPFVLCFPLGHELRQPRPVFHTLRWLISHLQGFRSVERLSPVFQEVEGEKGNRGKREKGKTGTWGSEQSLVEVYAYRVLVEGQPMYVLWAEDGVGQVMGEIEPSVTVTLPVATTAVTVTHVITATGQTGPLAEVVPADGGAVHLTVTETPIFVEGDTAPCSLAGDFDCDGEVTVIDVMSVAAHWDTRLGEAGYAPDFDLNRDGVTDVVDVMLVAKRYSV